MSLLKVHCGTSAPQEFNVIIEIPMNGEAVKVTYNFPVVFKLK